MLIARATRLLILALVLGAGAEVHAADPAAAEAERLARIAPAAAPAIRTDRIVPLLRTKLWLDRAAWELPAEATPSHQPLTDSLFIVFAEDNGLMVRPLAQREVDALGIAPADLRQLAVANLRQMLPAPEVKQSGGAKLFITPTGYGASRILLEEFWRDQRFQGEPVFALATHDMIVLADSTDHQGVETAKAVAGNMFKSYPFAISGALFVRCGGEFASYPR